jgi:hypothetical protein
LKLSSKAADFVRKGLGLVKEKLWLLLPS